MKSFVVGFAFSQDNQEVILIRRDKPGQFYGMLNGPGGHVEPHERPEDAMAREFEEEAGVRVPRDLWRELVTLTVHGSRQITFFAADLSIELFNQAHKTSDEGEIYSMAVETILQQRLVPAGHWIIPLALDRSIDLPLHVNSR